jgi:hypothetical protein
MDLDKIRQVGDKSIAESEHLSSWDVVIMLEEFIVQHLAEHHSRCPVCVVDDDPLTGLSGTMESELHFVTCVGCQQALVDSGKYFNAGGWWHWHCLMNKLQSQSPQKKEEKP